MPTALPGASFLEVAGKDIAHNRKMERTDRVKKASGLFDSNAFTPLDRILLRGIIDAVEEVAGAAPVSAMQEAIQELVSLSSSRHRSRFLAAFLATLAGQPQPRRSSGIKDRAWARAGRILALRHMGSLDAIAHEYRSDRSQHRELLESGEPCALVTLPHLFRSLFLAGDIAEAAKAVPPELLAKVNLDFRWELLHRASDFLRQQDPTDARLLLDLLRQAQSISALSGRFQIELARRHGQCLRAEGHFLASREVFTGLLDHEEAIDRAEVLADLGLAQCGFRGLPELRIPKDRDLVAPLVEKLKAGEASFHKALSTPDAHVTNAHLVLGILDLLEKRNDESREHLERAYQGAGERLDLYRTSHVYERIQLYYGLSIFLSLFEAGFAQATSLLAVASDQCKPHPLPPCLVAQAVEIGVTLE